MKADLSTMIGGQPMLVIRKFLRRAVSSIWGVSYLLRSFEIGEEETQELVAAMARKGYIKKSDNAIGGSCGRSLSAGRGSLLPMSQKRSRGKLPTG